MGLVTGRCFPTLEAAMNAIRTCSLVQAPGLATAVLLGTLLSIAAPASAQNLVTNPGFELGIQDWFAFGPATISAPTTLPHTGAHSAFVADRTDTWQGIAQSMMDTLVPGQEYFISGWVRLDNAASDTVRITIRQIDTSGTQYHWVDWQTTSDASWLQLAGYFTPNVTGTLTDLTVYFEGPAAGVDFYVDDVYVGEADNWRVEADARIEQIRRRDARVHVVDEAGCPLAGVDVDVQQVANRFAFGSAINGTVLTDPTYADFFRDNFEWAVMENESKWRRNEPSPGNVTYETADGIVSFCQDNGILLRGHTVFWANGDREPGWIAPLSAPDLQAAMEGRIASVVDHFRDVFLHWDVNNEMLHHGFYQGRLGPSIRPWMFQQVHAVDANALLFVNDYNVVASTQTTDYQAHIRQLMAAGAPVQAIGAQCHFFSGDVSPFLLKARIESLAELGLPIWCTEFDVVDPYEASRADKLEAFYRTAFSLPAVEGVLMWGFWAGSHWQGPSAAIVNLDWTLNAAGERYQALRAEWTTATAGSSDRNGDFEFRGFHGTYDITLTPAGGTPVTEQVVLHPGPWVEVVTLTLDGIQGNCPCVADLDDDGVVGAADFLLLLSVWGACSGECPADFDDDGVVGVSDIVLLVDSWGVCP
jgi:GH35 family endo-1,4-beta-xylanase